MASKEKAAISKSNPLKFGKYLFYPGAKVEAMDFLKNWYQAKVIKVKEDDQKVLIHFEGWNQRYDEWMPFSSDKIRPLMRQSARTPDSPEKLKVWTLGDAVKARWSDAKFYPAEVVEVLDEGMYKVKFFDGFEKNVSGLSLKKNKNSSSSKKVNSNAEKVESLDHNKKEDKKVVVGPSLAAVRSKRRHVEPISMADFVTPVKKVKPITQVSISVSQSRKEGRPKPATNSTPTLKKGSSKVTCSSTKFTAIKQKQSILKSKVNSTSPDNEKADNSGICAYSSSEDSSTKSDSQSATTKPVLKVKFFPKGRKTKRSNGTGSELNNISTTQSRKKDACKPSSASDADSNESPKRSRSSSVSSCHSKSPSQERDIAVDVKSNQKQARLKYTKTKAEKSKHTQDLIEEKRMKKNKETVRSNVFNSLLGHNSKQKVTSSQLHSSFSFSPEDDVKLSMLKSSVKDDPSDQHTESGASEVMSTDNSDGIKAEEIPVDVETFQVTVLDDNMEETVGLDRVDVVKNEEIVDVPYQAEEPNHTTEVSQSQVKRRRVRSRRPRREMEIASMVVQEWPSSQRGHPASGEPQSEILHIQPSDISASVPARQTPPQIIVPTLPQKTFEYFQAQKSINNRASPSSYYSSSPDITPSHSPMAPSGHQGFDNVYDCRDPLCKLPHQPSPTANTGMQPPPFFGSPYGIPGNGFEQPAGHFQLMPAPGMVHPMRMPRMPYRPDHTMHYLPAPRTMLPSSDIRSSPVEQQMNDTSIYKSPPVQQSVDSVALLQITKVESHAANSKPDAKATPENENVSNPKMNTVEFKVKKKRLDQITNKLSAQKKSLPSSVTSSPSTSPVVSRSLSDSEIIRSDEAPHRVPQVWAPSSHPQALYNQYPREMTSMRMPVYHNASGMVPNMNLPAAARLMSYASAYREFVRPDGTLHPMTVLSTKLLYPQPPIVSASSPRSSGPMSTVMYTSGANRPAYNIYPTQARPRFPQAYSFHPSYRFGPYEVPADPNYYPRPPVRPSGIDQRELRHPQYIINRNESNINIQQPMDANGKPIHFHERGQPTSMVNIIKVPNPDGLKYIARPVSADDNFCSLKEQENKPGSQPPSIEQQLQQSVAAVATPSVPRHSTSTGNDAATNASNSSNLKNTPAPDVKTKDDPEQPPCQDFDSSKECKDTNKKTGFCPPDSQPPNTEATKKVRRSSDKTLAPKEFVVQVDLNEYKCPVTNCDKSFRKSQLLEYHIKYYHSPRPDDVKRKRTSASLSSPDADSNLKHTSEVVQSKRTHHLSESHDTKPCSIDASTEPCTTASEHVVVDDDPSETGDDSTLDSDEDSDSSEIDDVIRCKCHAFVEQGFMIQCEQCLTWQHGDCVGLTVTTVPSKYLCYICTNPRGLRRGAKYTNDFDWYRLGKLPPLLPSDVRSLSDKDACKTSDITTATHALLEDIHNIEAVLRTIQLKLTGMSKSLAVEDLVNRAVARHAKIESSKTQPKSQDVQPTPNDSKMTSQTHVDGCSIAELQQYLTLLDDTETLEKQLNQRFDTLEQHTSVLKREYRRLSISQGKGIPPNNKCDQLRASDLNKVIQQLNNVSRMVMPAH